MDDIAGACVLSRHPDSARGDGNLDGWDEGERRYAQTQTMSVGFVFAAEWLYSVLCFFGGSS